MRARWHVPLRRQSSSEIPGESGGRELDRQSFETPRAGKWTHAAFADQPRLFQTLRNQMKALLDLGARDVLTEAHVHSATEGEVAILLRALRIESFGIGHRVGIPPGYAVRQKQHRFFREHDIAI